MVCDLAEGAVAPAVLQLFEHLTGELFSATPGALLTARVRSISRVLGNLGRKPMHCLPLVPGGEDTPQSAVGVLESPTQSSA